LIELFVHVHVIVSKRSCQKLFRSGQ